MAPRRDFAAEGAALNADRAAQFDQIMKMLQGPQGEGHWTPPPMPAPKPGLFQKYGPSAVRGVGALLGLTPLRGVGASAGAELAAEGIENAYGDREGLSPLEIAAAGVTGGLGGWATKSIGADKAIVSGIKGALAGGLSPVAHEAIVNQDLPDASDALMGAGVGGGVSYGLAKLLGAMGQVPFAKGKAPEAPVNEFTVETTAHQGPGTGIMGSGKDANKIVPVGTIPNIKAEGGPTGLAKTLGVAAEEAPADVSRITPMGHPPTEDPFQPHLMDHPVDQTEDLLARAKKLGLDATVDETEAVGPKLDDMADAANVSVVDPDPVPPLERNALDDAFDRVTARRGRQQEAGGLAGLEGPVAPPAIPTLNAPPLEKNGLDEAFQRFVERRGRQAEAGGLQGLMADAAPLEEELPADLSAIMDPHDPAAQAPQLPEQALARFFRGKGEALSSKTNPGFGYDDVKAAEKAGELPTEGWLTDSRGKPKTATRMYGKGLKDNPLGAEKIAPTGTPAALEGPSGATAELSPIATLTPAQEASGLNPASGLERQMPKGASEDLKNFFRRMATEGPRPGRRLGGDAGEITPEMATRLGLAGLGGVLGGAAAPDDHRPEGAALGAGLGFASPNIAKAVAGLANKLVAAGQVGTPASQAVAEGLAGPQGFKNSIEEIVNTLPQAIRFNFLASPNIINNAIVAPFSSGVMKGLELRLAGDPRGIAILEQLSPANWAAIYHESMPEAKQLIEEASRTGGPSFAESTGPLGKAFALPGVFMNAGDITTRKILMRAGLSEAEARFATATGDPELSFTKGLVNLQRSGGWFGQMALPFARTVANLGENAVFKTPGLGFLAQSFRETPDPLKNQIAQQLLGAGVLGASAGAGYEMGDVDNPVLKRFGRSFFTNAAGPYAGLAAMGYAGGLAKSGGDNFGQVVSKAGDAGFNQLPLPTVDLPKSYYHAVVGNAKGEHPLPTSAVPALSYLKELFGVGESSSKAKVAKKAKNR